MKQLAAIIALLAGCATVSSDPPNYTFRVIDQPERRAFVFELTSLDTRILCFSADDWPFVRGDRILNPVDLIVAGRRFPLNAGNSDAGMLCGLSKDRDCGTRRLAPRSVQTVQLDYAEFTDPAVIAADPTRHFDLYPAFPRVKVCHDQRSSPP